MNSRKLKNTRPGYLIRSWTAVLTLGLTTGGALAGKTHVKPLRFRPSMDSWAILVALNLVASSGWATDQGSLAEAATNPIGSLIQVQIQDQYNWSNHNSDGYSNSAILQPVIPVSLPWAAVPTMVTRTTLPYVTTPDLGGPVGRKNGFGDLSIIAPLIPKLKAKGIMIGLGPALSIPTATDDFTGSGKWAAGPTAVYFNGRTKGWQWGVLGWHLWDFAGEDDRDSVNKTFFQPFVVRHFGKGWYAGTPDVPGTYNWVNGQTTFPLGLRLGKVTKIGKQPVNLFGEVFASPWDDGASSEWSVKLSFTLLFPK